MHLNALKDRNLLCYSYYMKKSLVNYYVTLQEYLVSQLYSLNQEICRANLHLKIRNQRIDQEWFMKSSVMTVQKYMPGKLNAN